jgi:hypothetical protein
MTVREDLQRRIDEIDDNTTDLGRRLMKDAMISAMENMANEQLDRELEEDDGSL